MVADWRHIYFADILYYCADLFVSDTIGKRCYNGSLTATLISSCREGKPSNKKTVAIIFALNFEAKQLTISLSHKSSQFETTYIPMRTLKGLNTYTKLLCIIIRFARSFITKNRPCKVKLKILPRNRSCPNEIGILQSFEIISHSTKVLTRHCDKQFALNYRKWKRQGK